MQPNKKKLALVLGVLFLGMSGNTIAETGTFKVKVKTIPDVAIEQVTSLSYGANMFVDNAKSCLMNAATPGSLAADKMQYRGAVAVVKANYGDLTGTGCVNGPALGTPGVYKIKGIAGNTVNITIAGIATDDFSFAPNSGCVATFEGGTALDTCDAFVPGATFTKKLPLGGASEDAASGGSAGVSVAGELVFTVGGTISTLKALTEATAYTAKFPVTVIY